MNPNDNLISVNILGKAYKIKCPAESAHELQQAADYFNQQMQQFKRTSATTAIDNVTVIASLNICHELLQLKKQKNQYIDSMHDRIQSLQKRIENFLVTEEEVAV